MSKRTHNLNLLFQKVVERFGEKDALCFESRCYTYHQLNEDAQRCMWGLLHNKVYQRQVVALPATKSYEVYVALLAALRLGVPYSFYDTKSPLDRVLSQLEVLGDPLVVMDEADGSLQRDTIQNQYHCHELSTVCKLDRTLEEFSSDSLQRVGDTTIAYIMFTSGSTGTPKGVSISHGNLLYLISWIKEKVGVTAEDRLSGLNKQYFDNSVFDLYGSLFTGATLYPVADELLIDSASLFDYLEKQKISVWFSVPSLLVYHLSMAAKRVVALSSIRKILFGGEVFPKPSLKQLWEGYQGRPVELINVYGPTECTCICSMYPLKEEDFAPEKMEQIAPLGEVSDYFSYAVVDQENRPVATGEVGELTLGGGAVGKGYWGREDLSEKVFVSNPSSPYLKDLYYKTGDLVREQACGQVEFISRVDYQIKHMGHRIELPEIESVVLAGADIVEACAVYKQIGSSGYIQLYYHGAVEEEVVIALLEKKLPAYMRPRKIDKMDGLPKNKNGKIDRKKLGEL